MIPAGMAQHMAEEPDVKQRVFQRTAIDAEQVLCGPAARPLPQEQSPQGEQKKGQDHRRIVLQLQCKLGAFRKRFILSAPALARTEFKDIIAFMPDTGQAGHPPFCSAWERACSRHGRGRPPAPAAQAVRSSSGFFRVTMKSALFPASMEPVTSPTPASRALRRVAVWRANWLLTPQYLWK